MPFTRGPVQRLDLPVPMHVAEERGEEGNGSEGCATVTETHHEEGLVGFKGDNTQLLVKKLQICTIL